jgi:2,3-bisphosphoglycerate-dependent phosphoglycerate mutase
VLPYYCQDILPRVLGGTRTIVVAHGNSLRALVMVLDRLSRESIIDAEIETGAALVYVLNPDSTVATKKVFSPRVD